MASGGKGQGYFRLFGKENKLNLHFILYFKLFTFFGDNRIERKQMISKRQQNFTRTAVLKIASTYNYGLILICKQTMDDIPFLISMLSIFRANNFTAHKGSSSEILFLYFLHVRNQS